MKSAFVTITVVTPAYNRETTLPNLYQSLKNQTNKDFTWLVVDDGSTDDTEALILGYQQDAPFQVDYVKKENGGKHTALNVAIERVDTELFFIVDSDDVLTPDAIETIEEDWKRVNHENLCGIGYLRGYDETNIIGDSYPQDGDCDNFIHVRYNLDVTGDKAEVWVTKLLKQYGGFPECEDERFISESVLWIKVSRSHNMLLRNQIIYITEYLPGGLSDSGRKLRFNCPQLMAYGSLETMTSDFSLKNRVKQALLFIVYSKFGGKGISDIMRLNCKLKGYRGKAYPYPVFTKPEKCVNRIIIMMCYIPGILLFRYWMGKYMK